MADRTDTAFAFAQDTSKQVLVLATGIITITVTFLGSLKKNVPSHAFIDLHIAWILDAVSVTAGVLTLMALTGHLGRGKPTAERIYAGNVTFFYLLQFGTFVTGLAFTIAFGIRAA